MPNLSGPRAALQAAPGGAPATGGSNVLFTKTTARFSIGSTDDSKLRVEAQYNPKERQIDKQIPWQEHKSLTNGNEEKGSNSEQSDLEFNGKPTRSMSFELLFDSLETPDEPIATKIAVLEELSSVRFPGNTDPTKNRPHHCVALWGDPGGNRMPAFYCVIASLSTKYTMWDRSGVPVRATCNVKLTEAVNMGGGKGGGKK